MIKTVSELLDHYVSRKPLAPLTIRNYRNIVDRFECVATGFIKLIDEDVCLAWRSRILNEVSPVTYNSYLRLMRALFNYGVSRNLVPHNPFKLLYFYPNEIRRPRGITDDVYHTAIQHLKIHNDPAPGWFWLLVVRFMAHTGVRARQLVSLKWHDLDWDNLVIHLRAEGSKTRREWEIPLSANLVKPLEDLHARSVDASGTGPEKQVFNVTLFNSELHTPYKGNSLTVDQVNGFYRRLSDRIGVRITSRRLRHYLATKLANCGHPDLFAIQELLGHTDIRTTRMYVKTDVERIRRLMQNAGIE